MSSKINYIVYFIRSVNRTFLVILCRESKSTGFCVERKGWLRKRLNKKLIDELFEMELDDFLCIFKTSLEDIHEELFDGSGNKENLLRELEYPGDTWGKYYEF